jgi:hypothetical protein
MTAPPSIAHRLAALPKDQLHAVLADMPADQLATLPYVWELWRMPHQAPPLRAVDCLGHAGRSWRWQNESRCRDGARRGRKRQKA